MEGSAASLTGTQGRAKVSPLLINKSLGFIPMTGGGNDSTVKILAPTLTPPPELVPLQMYLPESESVTFSIIKLPSESTFILSLLSPIRRMSLGSSPGKRQSKRGVGSPPMVQGNLFEKPSFKTWSLGFAEMKGKART